MSIELESSDDLSSSALDISSLAEKHGGYTTYSNIDMDTRYAYGRLTLKVPKENVDSFLGEIKEKGYIIKSTIDSYEDVTLEYTDIESRMSVKLKARKRYESILDNANTIDEIISVQTKIDDITEEIESVQARLNVMNNKIDYTEINIDIDCKTSVSRESFFYRISNRIGDILYEAGDTFIEGLHWFINAVIVLMFIVPIGVIIIRIFMITIGKRKLSIISLLKKIKIKKKENKIKENTDENVNM